MLQHVTAYLATATIFLALDFVWLSYVAKRFYFERLDHLLLDSPRLGAAAAFYAVYVIGIVIFAVAPALKEQALGTAVLFGALFGFFAYATYDMTNYSTLRDWPLAIVVVDVAWGTVLTGFSAACGYWITRAILQ